jgi:Protein of unknown function (DUF3168)
LSAAYFTEIFTALGPLVSNRVYPLTFPQDPDVPVWPAIRYTPTGGAMQFTSCGDANDPDVTIQIDVVAATFAALLPLVGSVKTAFNTFSIPAVLENSPGFDYDAETKTHRAVMIYTLAGSTQN